MWRDRILELSPSASFAPPCPADALADVEHALGVALPRELRELLAESDGVVDEDLDLVWPARRILEDNRRFRSDAELAKLYMPFDPLLFFADAGNGDQFAFTICGGSTIPGDVFVWNHEDDSRAWVAPSLACYLEWWLSGRLKI